MSSRPELLEAVLRRFAAVAPAGWVRLVGTWTASVVPSGAVVLHGLTTAVVHGGDRWLYGRVGFDDDLHDAVVRLRALDDTPWTRLDLRVEQDGTFRVDLGHEPPAHPRAEAADRVGPPAVDHLAPWVAEHGTAPRTPAPVRDVIHEAPRRTPAPVTLAAAQVEAFARIAQAWAAEAPGDWVRVVGHEECDVTDASAGVWGVHVVVVRTPDGLVQEDFRPPSDLYFTSGDLVRDVTAASRTRAAVVELVVERDGHTVTVTESDPDSDEDTAGPVRGYLDRHRAELEDLAARLPAPPSPPGTASDAPRRWWRRG